MEAIKYLKILNGIIGVFNRNNYRVLPKLILWDKLLLRCVRKTKPLKIIVPTASTSLPTLAPDITEDGRAACFAINMIRMC